VGTAADCRCRSAPSRDCRHAVADLQPNEVVMSSSYLSDTWLGRSGNITQPANYVGSGVFPVVFFPEGEDAYAYTLSSYPYGLWYAFQLAPSGTVGPGSVLSFGAGAIVVNASYSWTGPYNWDGVTPLSPPPPDPDGVIAFAAGLLPPLYTVSGSASVGAVLTTPSGPYSFLPPGKITFTGTIATGVFTVDDGTTEFDGGGITLAPANAVPFANSGSAAVSFATIDQGGTLLLDDFATARFAGAVNASGPVDGLQVGAGKVVVSDASRLYTEGLDLGAIPGVTLGLHAELDVLGGSSATIVADGQRTIDIGDYLASSGTVDVVLASLVLDDETGNGITLGASGIGDIDATAGSVGVDGDLTLGAGSLGQGAIGLKVAASLEVMGSLTLGDGFKAFGLFNVGSDASALIYGDLIAGDVSTGLGSVLLTGDGAVLGVGSSVTIGGGGGSGAFNENDGAYAGILGGFTLGGSQGSSGAAFVSDAGTSLDVAGAMTVGDAGSGVAYVMGGAEATIGNLILGGEATGSGQLQLMGMGTTLTVVGDAVVGDDGNGSVNLSDGASADINGDLSGSGSATIQGATFEIDGHDELANVRFAGSGELDIGMVSPDQPAASVTNFATGDTIDLFTTPGGTAGTLDGTVLIVTGASGTIATVQLSGTYSDAVFDVGPDGVGGTMITLESGQEEPDADPEDDTAPTIIPPSSPLLNSGTAAVLGGPTVGDDDPSGKTFSVTLTLADGTLDTAASGTATVGGNDTGTLTVAGDLTDVNATLGSLAATVTLPGGQPAALDTLGVTVIDNFGAAATSDVLLSVTVPPPAPVLPPDGTFDWAQPVAGGAYDVAANWLPTNGPPGSADTAVFGAGLYTVTGDGAAGQVQIGGALTYAGTLTAIGLPDVPGVVIDGGSASFGGGAALVSEAGVVVGNTAGATLNFSGGAGGTFDTADDPGAVSLELGVYAGSAGGLNASGAGTTMTSDSDWEIGVSGAGQVAITDGAVASAGTGFVSGDFASVLGDSAGATGIMQVDGAGSRFDDTGGIYVGVAGTGDLFITDGATVTSDAPVGDLSAVVGYGQSGQTGGSGAVVVAGPGSLWDSEQDTTIGYYATGSVDVMSGGTFESDGSLMRIGRVAGSTGTLYVEADSTLLAPNATLLLGDAGIGVAGFYFGATGTLADLVLGAEGGSGALSIVASTLTVAGGVTVDSGVVMVTDVLAYVSATSAATESGILAASNVVIAGGGTVIDAGTITSAITLIGGTLLAAGMLPNAIEVAGGNLFAPSALLDNGGALEVTQLVTLDEGAALLIDQNATLVQGVAGFDFSNLLMFDNYDVGVPADNASLTGDVLTVYDEGGDALNSVTLQGDYTGDEFTVSQFGTIAVVTVGPTYAPPAPFNWNGTTGNFDVPGN
jgi:T5SS/PEP-CTERM-associated repeat protein